MGAAPIRVLFVCTHNSARSQMAEALLRQIGGARFDVQSAGVEPGRLNPLAVRAMAKLNLDIADARPKSFTEFTGQRFDYIITMCDDTREACPVIPGDTEQIHWTYPDPSAVEGDEAVRQRAFDVVAADLMNRLRPWVEVAKRERSIPA